MPWAEQHYTVAGSVLMLKSKHFRIHLLVLAHILVLSSLWNAY